MKFFPADSEVSFIMNSNSIADEGGSVTVCVDSGVTGGFQTELTVSLIALEDNAGE